MKPGSELHVDAEYVAKAYFCIFEIGVKLAHVLWRKLDSNTRDSADRNLNSIAYDLIAKSKYPLAANMLELATSEVFKKGSAELIQRLFFVNKAQAYKWMKNQEKVDSTLNSLDWSASRNDFQLAFAVLKDDYIRAAELMKKIGSGKDAEVKNHDYSDWPHFQEFVKSQEFLGAYLEVYSEPFMQVTDSAAAVLVFEAAGGPAGEGDAVG